jgi:RimJ/RimL family protein N-acetyltransferase
MLHTDIDAEGMATLLADCNLAIGAAGVSSFERCCLGVPTLLVMIAENQRDNASTLAGSGAARLLGWWADLTPDTVASAVRQLADNPAELVNMRRRALQITDGRGVDRVALALMPPRTAEGVEVTLRAASFSDSDLIYGWQQAPETRRYARNPEIPAWKDHVHWLAAKLSDPQVIFNVILADGIPAGVLRLDAVAPSSSYNECYEISVFVAPAFYRRGIATAALHAGRQLVPMAELQAVVLDANMASKRLFERAGFHSFGDLYRSLPNSPRADA